MALFNKKEAIYKEPFPKLIAALLARYVRFPLIAKKHRKYDNR